MGTTTKMAIPYPEATGLVKDGWEDMKDIATQVDAKSGLVLLNSTTISAASSVSAPINTFSANYENYLVLINLTTNSAADANIYLRLRSGSTDATAAYYWGRVGLTTGGSAKNLGGDNQAFFIVMEQDAAVVGYSHIALNIFSPFLSQKTKVNWLGTATDTTASVYGQAGGGVLDNTTSYDSFSLVNSAGTSTGKMTVYGYNV